MTFPCPICAAEVRLTDSRSAAERGHRRRRYRCDKCRESFTTIEQLCHIGNGTSNGPIAAEAEKIFKKQAWDEVVEAVKAMAATRK